MITLIAAVAQNQCIGAKGQLAWHIPEDLNHFKQLTLGKTVLMGERTWKSLPDKARPLPGRANVVVSSDLSFTAPEGVRVFNDLDQALKDLSSEDVFVMGGAMVYAQTIDRADRLEITHVHRVVDGDVFFPQIDPSRWQETTREDHPDFSFVTYQRRMT